MDGNASYQKVGYRIAYGITILNCCKSVGIVREDIEKKNGQRSLQIRYSNLIYLASYVNIYDEIKKNHSQKMVRGHENRINPRIMLGIHDDSYCRDSNSRLNT